MTILRSGEPPHHVVPQFESAATTSGDEAGTDGALLRALGVAVYLTDPSGRITDFNDAAVQLWGRSPEIGRDEWCGSWRLLWPDGRPMRHEECPMAVTLKEGETIALFEGAQ